MKNGNPDFAFAMNELHRAIAGANDTHRENDFETATRHLRLASRALADMRRANAEMLRWAHQAERF